MSNKFSDRHRENMHIKFSKEVKAGGFKCLKCGIWVMIHSQMGTKHRNHCYLCLWSKHVDEHIPGDRRSLCHGGMEPVALTVKSENGFKVPEIMLVHVCQSCEKISKNRVAADDSTDQIFSILSISEQLSSEFKGYLLQNQIIILTNDEKDLVETALFGIV